MAASLLESHIDRLIQAVLKSCGPKSEFIGPSKFIVRSCIVYLGCKKGNISKLGKDFPGVAQKVNPAVAEVVGALFQYGVVDGMNVTYFVSGGSTENRELMS